MRLISFISLILFIFIFFSKLKYFQKIFRTKLFLKYELVLLLLTGILFAFVFPWESQFKAALPFSQTVEIKAIVGFVRILSDIMIVLCVPFIFSKIRGVQQKISKFLFLFLLVQLIVTVIDFSFGYPIRNLIFEAPNIPGRFLGFNHEPRSFGRNSLYALIVLLFNYESKNKLDSYANKAIILAIINIIISFSLSTYIAFLLVFGLTSISNFKNIIVSGTVIIILFAFISKIEYVQQSTFSKFQRIIVQGENSLNKYDGPKIFSHFEMPNAAYLYFIWNDPKHLFLGTGPNLINIAYEKYAIEEWKIDNDYYVSVAPTIGLFRLLARGGILGLLILFIYLNQLNSVISKSSILKTEKLNRRKLLIRSAILFLIIYNQWFYFILGFLIYLNFRDHHKIKQSFFKLE